MPTTTITLTRNYVELGGNGAELVVGEDVSRQQALRLLNRGHAEGGEIPEVPSREEGIREAPDRQINDPRERSTGDEAPEGAGSGEGAEEVEAASDDAETAEEAEEVEEAEEDVEIDATAAAVELAEENGIDLSEVDGNGQDGRITKPDVEALVESDEE